MPATWCRHYREAGEDEKQNIRLARRSNGFRAFIEDARSLVQRPPDHSNCLSGQTSVSLPFYTSILSSQQQLIGVK